MIQNRNQSYFHRIVTIKPILANIISLCQWGEKNLLKSQLPDSDQVIKMCKRTTLAEKQLKELCDEEVDVLTYEYSDEIQKRLKNNKEMLPLLQAFLK